MEVLRDVDLREIISHTGNEAAQEIVEIVETKPLKGEAYSTSVAREVTERLIVLESQQRRETLAREQVCMERGLNELSGEIEAIERNRVEAETRLDNAKTETERRKAKDYIEDVKTRLNEKRETLQKEELRRWDLVDSQREVERENREAQRRAKKAAETRRKAMERRK